MLNTSVDGLVVINDAHFNLHDSQRQAFHKRFPGLKSFNYEYTDDVEILLGVKYAFDLKDYVHDKELVESIEFSNIHPLIQNLIAHLLITHSKLCGLRLAFIRGNNHSTAFDEYLTIKESVTNTIGQLLSHILFESNSSHFSDQTWSRIDSSVLSKLTTITTKVIHQGVKPILVNVELSNGNSLPKLLYATNVTSLIHSVSETIIAAEQITHAIGTPFFNEIKIADISFKKKFEKALADFKSKLSMGKVKPSNGASRDLYCESLGFKSGYQSLKWAFPKKPPAPDSDIYLSLGVAMGVVLKFAIAVQKTDFAKHGDTHDICRKLISNVINIRGIKDAINPDLVISSIDSTLTLNKYISICTEMAGSLKYDFPSLNEIEMLTTSLTRDEEWVLTYVKLYLLANSTSKATIKIPQNHKVLPAGKPGWWADDTTSVDIIKTNLNLNLPPHQSWNCDAGCGECTPKLSKEIVETSAQNNHIKRQVQAEVYTCDKCGSSISVWDEDKQDTLPVNHASGEIWQGGTCGYQSGTMECRGDGYLWDADHDGFDKYDISYPCPDCRTKEYLENAKEQAESTSSFFNMSSSGTGVDIWQGAVKHALEQNGGAAEQALKEIGKVEAIFDDPNNPDETLTKTFNYK